MTIKQRQYLQNVSQGKKIVVLESQKEKLNEAAPEELLEQGGLRKKQWNATANQWDSTISANGTQTAQLSPQIEVVCPSEERPLFEGKLTEGGNNHLLILANFAELMSESEDNFHTVDLTRQDHGDSIMEAQNLQENINVDEVMATDTDKNCHKVDEISLIVHKRNERDGSHCEGKVTRLSQMRRQARLKSQSFIQQSIQEGSSRHLQGSKTRLTQIRCQARLGDHVPVQENSAGCSHGKLLGGITRMSQIRRQARSKNNCSLQEGTGEHMQRQLDCQFHEVDAVNADKVMCERGKLCFSQLRRKIHSRNVDMVAQRKTEILHE
ncbi:hypothetical protein DITRI_Ditri02bG0187500 [Diplodiscus trichospermus]